MSVEAESGAESDAGDPFDAVHKEREAVERLGAERNDRLGAFARVVVALADGERPTDADLIAAGLPTPGQMEGE